MSEPGGGSLPFRVGDWHVEPRLFRLFRLSGDERQAHLEPKVMRLLSHLAASGRRLRTRGEILAAVWPDVVVGDDSLHQAISKLRRALGDSAADPRYVETVAKLGYRLVADVDFAPHDSRRGLSPDSWHPWLSLALPASLVLVTWLATRLAQPKPISGSIAKATAAARSGRP